MTVQIPPSDSPPNCPTIVVQPRFCGPPDSANGGYLAGRLAVHVPGAAQVTLRRPPRLATPLIVAEAEDRVLLLDGDAVVAEGQSVRWDLAVPDPVTVETAARVQGTGIWQGESHPFPTCFVCGPDNERGLRVFPGAVPGRGGLVVAEWTPTADLARQGSTVATEFLWAALDCPASYGARAGDPTMPARAVLGRMSARIGRAAEPEVPLVVSGWFISRAGRKIEAGSALHDADGHPVAVARSTWITID